jgi:hypothetical protein
MLTALGSIKYYQIFGIPLIMYIGLLALFFLLGTALIPIINKKKGSRSLVQWHHRMAALCIIFALFHGLLGLSGDIKTMPESDMKNAGSTERPEGLSDMLAGENIFEDRCSGCHPDGKNIIRPDLPIKGSLKISDFTTFLHFIRNPLLPDGLKGPMPSFSGRKISDSQARSLYQYLISEKGMNAMKRERRN